MDRSKTGPNFTRRSNQTKQPSSTRLASWVERTSLSALVREPPRQRTKVSAFHHACPSDERRSQETKSGARAGRLRFLASLCGSGFDLRLRRVAAAYRRVQRSLGRNLGVRVFP